MPKGHIIGSKPARDPMDELQDSRLSVVSDSNLMWQNREAKRPWNWVMVSTLLSLLFVFVAPWMVSVYCIGVTMVLFLMSLAFGPRDARAMRDHDWCIINEPDLSFVRGRKQIEVRGTGGARYVVAQYLKKASTNLPGRLGQLVRAIDSSLGFSVIVNLQREEPKRLLEGDIVTPRLERFFNKTLGTGGIKSYMSNRGGLWKTTLTLLGHTRTEGELRAYISASRAAIAEKGLKRLPSQTALARVASNTVPLDGPAFYASGEELAGWLVQLASELASEVGSNIPGEFVAPIRPKQVDYPLGLVIDPETLRTGRSTGLSSSDIRNGLLVCGGDWDGRFDIMSMLVGQHLGRGKRVLVVTSREETKSLTGLHDEGIGLRLGSDFILNPVDCEDMNRANYVVQLKSALQVMTGPLRVLDGASDLERALAKAVALPNATLADVKFIVEEGEAETGGEGPSIDSRRGMDAIRTLHQGSGARSFYGSQTAPMAKLADNPLTVISVDLGGGPIEVFAWDLFCIKIAGLLEDPDLIVILDSPPNFVLDNKRNDRRQPWVERMVNDLLKTHSLVVSMRQPSQLRVIADRFSCCVSLALRHGFDIKVVSDLLGLSVIGGSMHSKARISARESAYLRTLEDGQALIVDCPAATCYPIVLDSPPETISPSFGELEERRSRIITVPANPEERGSGAILNLVAGKNEELATEVLGLLEKYEPLTEEAVRKIIESSGRQGADIEGVLMRLESAAMVLRGHEIHGGVSYTNFRLTLKGSMALSQSQARSVST